MNLQLPTLIPALVLGFLGGYLGSISGLYTEAPETPIITKKTNTHKQPFNPFQSSSALEDPEYQFEALQLKIEGLQIQIENLQKNQKEVAQNTHSSSTQKPTSRSLLSPNKDNLIRAGINPDIADDILRRMSEQDFRRLELQNLIQRSSPAQRRQYGKELRELNSNKISLRSEMGNDSYDQYLFISGQNNRVKVSSVMAGSPAESSGLQAEDIILSYDNKKILNWTDIRSATIEGEIGSYTSVEVLRDGEQMSLMVPRGTLGVQLDATQIDPQK